MKKLVLACALLFLIPSMASAQIRRPLDQIQSDITQAADSIAQATERLRALAAELLLPEKPPEVEAGESLQAALNDLAPGTTLVLTPGATYLGNFINRQSGVRVTTRGATDDPATWAKIVTPNSVSALVSLGSDVTYSRVHFAAVDGAFVNDLVMIGYGDSRQTRFEQQPRNTVFEYVTMRGNGLTKRGLTANGANMTLDHVEITNIARPGQDSSGIGMWNGEGPLTVRHALIEAASEDILIGGNVPSIPGLVPSDILVEDSVLTKNIAWRGLNPGVAIKNVFELKVGRRVTVRRSLLEYSWPDGQAGSCVMLTPSQGLLGGTTGNPDTVIEDVTFEDNTIRNCAVGVTLNGLSQNQATNPVLRSQRITFRRNLIQVSRALYGGHGTTFIFGIEPYDITIDRNTIEQDGDAVLRFSDSKVILGFKFTGNLVNKPGTYVAFASWGYRGVGFDTHLPDAVVTDNAFVLAHATWKATFPNNTYSNTVEGLTGFGR